ncbi:MAG: J domain-containing protein [Actinomycetota bacterium]
MSLAYRLWQVARRRILLSLGMVQGAAFRDGAGQQPRASATRAKHPCAAEYQLLGAPIGADAVTLRRCWRAQVRRYHPDLYGHSPVAQQQAADRLRRVNAAYQRILTWMDQRP